MLNGTARGALIHQRGELPLHACTLLPPGADRAVAICGRSGAGKSTLGATLSRRGWLLVADDTTRVTWNEDHPLAWPSKDSIKLWKDACERAGLDTASLQRVMRDMEKFYVRVPSHQQPVRLGTIIELSTDIDGRALTAGDRMAMVSRHTYRPTHIQPLGVQGEHVRIVARIASACTMLQLPGDRSLSADALADTVVAAVR
jgi:ATPase subunit of ABC transporter with duplicated ATPase domains